MPLLNSEAAFQCCAPCAGGATSERMISQGSNVQSTGHTCAVIDSGALQRGPPLRECDSASSAWLPVVTAAFCAPATGRRGGVLEWQ